MQTTRPMTGPQSKPTVSKLDPPMQKIATYLGTGLRHGGAVTVDLPADADVIHLEPSKDGNLLGVYATVNVDAFGQETGPRESRIFWIAFTGDKLPGDRYPKADFEKIYLRSMIVQMSAVADVPTLVHVWQIRSRDRAIG